MDRKLIFYIFLIGCALIKGEDEQCSISIEGLDDFDINQVSDLNKI